jgi:hypothetical protein
MEKGKEMTFPIKKEDVHTTIKKPLSNTNLPFTNRVMSVHPPIISKFLQLVVTMEEETPLPI